MRKKFNAAFLILLLVGSFILHTGVHGPFCAGHPSHGGPSPAGGNVFSPPECGPSISTDHPEYDAASDLFCPVCAGWLNADLPQHSGPAPRHFTAAAVGTARSAAVIRPRQEQASPRAPPQI